MHHTSMKHLLGSMTNLVPTVCRPHTPHLQTGKRTNLFVVTKLRHVTETAGNTVRNSHSTSFKYVYK